MVKIAVEARTIVMGLFLLSAGRGLLKGHFEVSLSPLDRNSENSHNGRGNGCSAVFMSSSSPDDGGEKDANRNNCCTDMEGRRRGSYGGRVPRLGKLDTAITVSHAVKCAPPCSFRDALSIRGRGHASAVRLPHREAHSIDATTSTSGTSRNSQKQCVILFAFT